MGFTLIELILVLVIIAAMVAVAAPSLSRMNRKQRIDGQARLLISLHASARSLAMRDGRPTRLVIDPDEHEVWIEVQQGGGYQEQKRSDGRRVALSPRVEMTFERAGRESGRYTLACEPNGVTQPVAIELKDDTGREALVYCPSASEGLVAGEPGDTVTLTWGVDDASL